VYFLWHFSLGNTHRDQEEFAMVKLTFEKRRAQLRQDTVPCTIIIDGDGDWKRFFTEEVPLTSPQWIEWCGGTPVSLLIPRTLAPLFFSVPVKLDFKFLQLEVAPQE
jgi:hypothetical protein